MQTWSQTHCDTQTQTQTHRYIRDIGQRKEGALAERARGEENEKKEEEKLQKHVKADKKKEKEVRAEKQEKEGKEKEEEEEEEEKQQHPAASEKRISSRLLPGTQVLAPIPSKNEGITPKDNDIPSKKGGITSKDEGTPQTTPQTPSALDLLKSFNSSKTSSARRPDKVKRKNQSRSLHSAFL
jgi:hypothetical protein